jgi:hypothetical protein
LQELQTYGPQYNVSIATYVLADVSKDSYDAELEKIIKFNVQTIVLSMSTHDAVVV